MENLMPMIMKLSVMRCSRASMVACQWSQRRQLSIDMVGGQKHWQASRTEVIANPHRLVVHEPRTSPA
eukprot:683142-Rhodomonas_salina.28